MVHPCLVPTLIPNTDNFFNGNVMTVTGHMANVRVPNLVRMGGILMGHWHARSWLCEHPEHAVAAMMTLHDRLGTDADISTLH